MAPRSEDNQKESLAKVKACTSAGNHWDVETQKCYNSENMKNLTEENNSMLGKLRLKCEGYRGVWDENTVTCHTTDKQNGCQLTHENTWRVCKGQPDVTYPYLGTQDQCKVEWLPCNDPTRQMRNIEDLNRLNTRICLPGSIAKGDGLTYKCKAKDGSTCTTRNRVSCIPESDESNIRMSNLINIGAIGGVIIVMLIILVMILG